MNRGGRLERRTPLAPGGPLPRTPLRTRAVQLPRVAPEPKPKTRAGEFTAATRRQLRARFAGLCAVCGLPLPPFGWTGQHRRARGAGGSTAPDTASAANGVAVHELPCHRWIEGNPTAALPLGLRVPQGTDPATVPVQLYDGRRVWLDHSGGYSENPPDLTEETRAA